MTKKVRDVSSFSSKPLLLLFFSKIVIRFVNTYISMYTVYHLPTCNSIGVMGLLILILILSHIFEASIEVSANGTVNGSNICEWIKYL